MRTLIIYDSFYGNTEQIANTIYESFPRNDVEIKKVNKATVEDLLDIDLLIVGSPTRAFNPSPDITEFIKQMPKKILINKKVLVFDTRINSQDIDSKILRFLMKTFGYASEKLANKLQKKGGNLIGNQAFYVDDKEGPLQETEIKKTLDWIENSLS